MIPVESRHIDRTGWPPGQWDDEPDRVEWRIRRFAALIVRNRSGALCGYIGLPPEHPWHGKHYNDIACLDCHGGLTFSDKCQEGGKICHVPQPGEPDAVWWLGFDCNHSGDLAPDTKPGWREPYARYASIEYVKRQVQLLAEQCEVSP